MDKKQKTIYLFGVSMTALMALCPIPMQIDGAGYSDAVFTNPDMPPNEFEDVAYTYTLQASVDSSTGPSNPITF